jgi:hypothetical protein
VLLTEHHPRRRSGGAELQLHAFLTSTLDGGEWSALRTGCFTPRERALGTHRIGMWVVSRAGLDTVVKKKIQAPPGTRTPDHTGSPALYHCYINTNYGNCHDTRLLTAIRADSCNIRECMSDDCWTRTTPWEGMMCRGTPVLSLSIVCTVLPIELTHQPLASCSVWLFHCERDNET